VKPHTDAGAGGAPKGLTILWDMNANHMKLGQQITYRCLPGSPNQLYGTDVYSGDSSICTAAVHAGQTTTAGGTDFIVEASAGQASYLGSTRNGVTSDNWGSYEKSFRVLPAP
jgi:hypothetical protein